MSSINNRPQDYSAGSYTSNGNSGSENGLSPNIPGGNNHPPPGSAVADTRPSNYVSVTPGAGNAHPPTGNDYATSANTGSQPWQNYAGTQDATYIPPTAAANSSAATDKVKLDEADIRAKARKVFSDGRVTLAELQQLRANKPADDDGASRYREILNEELNSATRAGKISSSTIQSLRTNAPDLFSGAHLGGGINPNINDMAMGTMQDFGFTSVQ